MKNTKPLLPVIVMQFIPILIIPPQILFSLNGVLFSLMVLALFGGLGYALVRRKIWARNLSIFIHGFNIIVRVMMVFPNARAANGDWDLAFILTSLASIAISFWFLQRLDRPDFQALVTS